MRVKRLKVPEFAEFAEADRTIWEVLRGRRIASRLKDEGRIEGIVATEAFPKTPSGLSPVISFDGHEDVYPVELLKNDFLFETVTIPVGDSGAPFWDKVAQRKALASATENERRAAIEKLERQRRARADAEARSYSAALQKELLERIKRLRPVRESWHDNEAKLRLHYGTSPTVWRDDVRKLHRDPRLASTSPENTESLSLALELVDHFSTTGDIKFAAQASKHLRKCAAFWASLIVTEIGLARTKSHDDETRAILFTTRAAAHIDLCQFPQAEDCAVHAMELLSSHRHPHLVLGRLYNRWRRPELAEYHWKSAATLRDLEGDDWDY